MVTSLFFRPNNLALVSYLLVGYGQSREARAGLDDSSAQNGSRTVRPSELAGKLGIKPGMAVLLQGAPPGFATQLGSLPDGAKLLTTSTRAADCVIAFVRSKADVKTMAPSVLRAVIANGLLWFAYPKKSGPLRSDLSRDSGWEPVFESGFDSVAQISIDDTWTGFRFRPKHLVGKRAR